MGLRYQSEIGVQQVASLTSSQSSLGGTALGPRSDTHKRPYSQSWDTYDPLQPIPVNTPARSLCRLIDSSLPSLTRLLGLKCFDGDDYDASRGRPAGSGSNRQAGWGPLKLAAIENWPDRAKTASF